MLGHGGLLNPRNHDEPVEWPDEAPHPTLDELIDLVELAELNLDPQEDE